jgi:nuclear protein localization protein 4 homolog
MTFTRESGREFLCIYMWSMIQSNFHFLSSIPLFSPDAGPTNSVSGVSGGMMDSDIPQEVLDQIAAEEASHGGVSRDSGGSSGVSSGIRVCPHCTFENDHGGTDCEVCGLPLV